MAPKRSAREAFLLGKPATAGQLSAAAALKQVRPAVALAQPASHSEQHAMTPAKPLPLATTTTLAHPPSPPPYDPIGEETSSDGQVMIVDVDADAPSTPSIPLSTWRPTKQNVVRADKHDYEVRLKANDSITMVGDYHLTLSSGLITIAGATLHPASRPQRVYALPTQALPAVMARKASTVQFRSVASNVDILSRYSPLFRGVGTDGDMGRSFSFLSTSNDDSRPLAPLEIVNDTKNVVSRLVAKATGNARPRIMAIGGKSTGKSTLNRLLCNTIVTWPEKPDLYYLDLDPGQPEFAPPGQISLVKVASPLLGPPLTHPASPRSRRLPLLRSHTIAATSFKDDPELYMTCVKNLASHIPRNAVVIINSCGWINGLGATVLLELTTALQVTDAVLMQPIDTHLEEAVRKQVSSVHVLPRKQGRIASRSPAEQRAMQTMAYFHHKHSSSTDSIKWVDKSIDTIRPWTVSYAPERPGIVAVLSYGQAPHPNFLAEVLDGSIVAIVMLEEAYTLDDIQHTQGELLPYSSLKSLDPERSQCVGTALVRGIDTDEKELYLVTPLGESEIANIMDKQVVLVRGALDSPGWAYTEDLYANDEAFDNDRPWVRKGGQAGIEGAIWRLRHPPTRDQTRQA